MAGCRVVAPDILDRLSRGHFLDQIAATSGRCDVVVDLRPVRFFDGAGLRALVAAVRLVHDRDGRVWLRCHPGPVAARLTEAGMARLAPIELACRWAIGPRRETTARLGQVRRATPSA